MTKLFSIVFFLLALCLSSNHVITTTAICAALSLNNDNELESNSNSSPPNNKKDQLVEQYGEDGYRQMVSSAIGMESNEHHDGELVCSSSSEDASCSSLPSSSSIYGVDISFPIHHAKYVSTNYPWLPHNIDPQNIPTPSEFINEPLQPLGDRHGFYRNYIEPCESYYRVYSDGLRSCATGEMDRIALNLNQPSLMQNYTELGFQKIRAPSKMFKRAKSFWEANQQSQTMEKWGFKNTLSNHWTSPTYMLNIDDESLQMPGALNSQQFQKSIREAAQHALEEWTGETLTFSSMYGIRVYKNGAVEAPHVDRMPMVISAVMNVAQDVDEEWPLEVHAHDGRAYNVTLKPGEMMLYESHSVIHGRPFPLVGRFYAGVFAHFEPMGHSFRHNARRRGGGHSPADLYRDMKGKPRPVSQVKSSSSSKNEDQKLNYPEYILHGSGEETKWTNQDVPGAKKKTKVSVEIRRVRNAHKAASNDDINTLLEIAEEDVTKLFHKDGNEWQPIHEAARGGYTDIIKLLIKKGADVNARTNGGNGGTPLYWVKRAHGEKHPAYKVLKEAGGIIEEPITSEGQKL